MDINHDIIIGLEIHTELSTASKMFCACANHELGAEPNAQVCPICLGHPGTLPAVNSQALNFGLLLGLALNCKIAEFSKFDRKNYFYPDLPKGYQISQYDLPICTGGCLTIADGHEIAITRIHLEEDTGKLTHDSAGHSLVDFNRAGVPLIEMVTDPVIKNGAEAKAFCQRFQQILRYLKISDANMEKGQMRCEANISLQKPGTWEYRDGKILPIGDITLNNKVEVKNINSFKAVEKAIDFEIARQSKLLNKGETVLAETRGFNDNTNETVSQRVKETAADYRYFPEPDIPPLIITPALLKKIKANLVELPQAKTGRFREEYNLSEYDAEVLTADQAFADWAEKVFSEVRAAVEAQGEDWQRHKTELSKLATNWLTGELTKHLNLNNQAINNIKIKPADLAHLIALIFEDKINSSAAQMILSQMYQVGGDPEDIMIKLNLQQLDNADELEAIARKVLAENKQQADEYFAGKESLMQFFVGKIMAATGGKANPQKIPEIIKKISNNLT